jgi:hypothetical protein
MYGYDWLGYGLEISTPYGTVYKDIEHFRKHDQWNAGYTEV